MSTLTNFLGTFGFKSTVTDEYQKNTLTVIEEAIKVEKLLKAYIDQQRMFTDSLVEWTASKEPTKTSLSNLARILSQINFEWTKSQEVFRESISRVRHEFEVIATDMGDREYFETRYESARKELESQRKKLDKGGKVSDSDRIRVVEKEKRKRRDFEEYLANRENQTMVKVKRSFHGLAHGFMHQGASSFNIYQAFQTALSNILPDDEYQLSPIILKPSDYLAISEGRAESSLAIEKEISRSRANSLSRIEDNKRSLRSTKSAPALSLTSAGHSELDELLKSSERSMDENSKPMKEEAENKKEGKKKKRKHRNKAKKQNKADSLVPEPNLFEGLRAETSELSQKSPSIDQVNHSETSQEKASDKPGTPTSVSGTIRSSSIENNSVPASEGFDVTTSNRPTSEDNSEKSLRSPMPVTDHVELVGRARSASPVSNSEVVHESPIEHV